MNESILELKDIVKTFPGVVALKNVSMTVRRNEILGLVGENGAGKSTLMKILIGLYQPDSGEFLLRGEPASLKDPDSAMRAGIGMVFQEGCMIPNLTVMENIFLSHEENFRRYGFLSRNAMAKEASKALAEVNLRLDPATLVSDLSAGDKQMVEIARLLWLLRRYGQENPILILDEPTTVLLREEVETLFKILTELKKSASIIFISHRLEEVIENTDRIVVLKDGEFVTEMESSKAEMAHVESLLVGHGFSDDRYHESAQSDPGGDVVLEVDQLAREGKFEPISFSLKRGEVLSLVGLIGSGKEEVCRCLAGLTPADGGEIRVNGRRVGIRSPKDAIRAGIGYIPVDRRSDGLALDLNVEENINLLVLKKYQTGPFSDLRREHENASFWVKENNIKTPSLRTRTANLSGGNQQKVVLSKWLSSSVKVLIVDHPTRGIDVGAKDEIYRRLRALADEGMSIIVMCDTLEEDIGLAHRMIIMKDGSLVREIPCPRSEKPRPVDVIGYIV
ncbi:sugar ABC transporter ATP-binding protein [Salinispira pacifica]